MIDTISNSRLSVSVSDYGAELQSVKLDGAERLWQGDPAVWEGRAPVLFPFVGRIKNGEYTYNGVSYPAPTAHGFASRSLFSLAEKTEDTLVYRLISSEETKKEYPFNFIFDVIYTIRENTLIQSFRVKNTGSDSMLYSFGAHPGFLVPPDGESEFSDWYLEFAQGQPPLKQAMLDGLFMSRRLEPCRFAEDNRISLYHEMFDDDAFILAELGNKVFSLKNDKNGRKITVDCSDFAYLSFWQATGSGANFLCIEPWNGLPSDSQAPEDLSVKRDLRCLHAGETDVCSVSFRFD